MDSTRHALVQPVVGLAAIGIMLVLAYQVISPFLVALAWATILVFVTWKPFEWLAWIVRSRVLAALLMVLAFSLILALPLLVAGIELSTRIDAIGNWYTEKLAGGWPPVPAWIASLPWIGPQIDQFWMALGIRDPVAVAKAQEWGKVIVGLLLKFGAALGNGLLLMLLSLILSIFIYISGGQLVRWLFALLEQVVGERGEELLVVAAATVKGVVYGIIGTALVQGALAFFGYWIAGVPNALSFSLITCLLSLIPGGPSLLGLSVALWLYQQGEAGWAIFLAIWMVGVVGTADNVVKPFLIGKGSELPFALILIGVVGGAVAWGALGLFLGPTLLAVCYNVLQQWAFPKKETPGRVSVG